VDPLTFRFPASQPTVRRSHVGVVGSGDCEVLVEPPPGGSEGAAGDLEVEVTVRTTVVGFDTTWRWVLTSFFERYPYAGRYQVNDQGATPGVVGLRLLQAQAGAR
jgi:malonate decarboxylase delta subunit